MGSLNRTGIENLHRILTTFAIFCAVFTAHSFGQTYVDLQPSTIIATASTPSILPDAPIPNIGSDAKSSNEAYEPGTRPANSELTLKRLPLRFLGDELHIVKSPTSIHKNDLRWLLPLAGASAAALATDTKVMRDVVSRNPSFNQANSTSSDVLRDAAVGVPVLLFGVGSLNHNERSREAGLLGGEAMIDAYVFDEAIKYVTLRERPNINNARGRFLTGDAASDPSFISGHSIVTWSSAAVLAGEYSKPWQQAAIYTLASGVSLTRVLGQQHFPSDTLLGSAAGWLIGHYVYRAHHRRHHH
ncbi:MAG TPA: phosphatase PAP2 family protein [Acidobacteriaceae bacterium]|jgi:hypothetical protein